MCLPLKKLNVALGTILVVLMPILYLMDAPEYVKCDHPGICEFLELTGISNTSKDAKSNSINNRRYHHLSSCYQLIPVKNHDLIALFYVLKRYINPYLQKNSCYLHEKLIKILINKKYIAYKKSLILSAKWFNIITSSVIRS